MNIDDMNRIRRLYGFSYRTVSEKTGLPLSTVQKVLGGRIKSPRYETLSALNAFFFEWDTSYHYSNDGTQDMLMVHESEASYNRDLGRKKKQGEYTIEDYYKLPEDRRVELIDGVFYDMASPSSVHQMIVGQLHAMFLSLIDKSGKDCIPFMAPSDVKIDPGDNKTIVEPDLFIICDRSKISKKRINGAPDLIIEVISPSSRKYDYYTKYERYARAGVREYWIVDWERERVTVYDLINDIPHLYSFSDTVSIGISDGGASIDFSRVRDYISFLL